MEMSHAKGKELWDKFQNAKARLRSVREESEAAVGRAKMTAEVLGGAALAGYLNAKQGTAATATTAAQPWQLFGFPADMGIGFLGVGLAMVGVAGKYDEDVLGLALGFGASWAVREGAALAAATPATQTAGALPAGQYAGALPAGQYAGAVPAGQYAGAIPAGRYGAQVR